MLRGRCRDCKSPISSLYPTIEVISGLLAWLLFRTIVTEFEQVDAAHLVAFVFQFSFVSMLLAQAFIDIKYYIIPDEFSIYAIPYAVGGVALIHWLGYPDAMTWKVSVIGALVGGGLLGGVTLTWWLIRRSEGMGWGDVKLLALIGAMLGPWPALPFVMMVSATAAVVVGLPLNIIRGNARYALPFGPFLAFGSILYLLHGEGLMERWFPGSGLFAEMIRQSLN